jgi:hypothetical protein
MVSLQLMGSYRKKKKRRCFVNPKSNVPNLSLSDLEISDVDIFGLTKEDALGVPELGASFGTFGCCTQQNCIISNCIA